MTLVLAPLAAADKEPARRLTDSAAVLAEITAAAGRMANKPAMVATGNADTLAGRFQKTSGRIKKAAGK